MAYTPKTWVDETPNTTPIKFKITDDTLGIVAASAKIEIQTAVTAGTPVNATNLNHIELGIQTAQSTADTVTNTAANALSIANNASTAATGAATTAASANTTALDAQNIAQIGVRMGIGIVIGSGNDTITTGVKGYLEAPFAFTIERVTLLADVSGSIVVDIWKAAYASYPPVSGNTITASARPTITSAIKSQDATLTGWTLTVAKGDILAFNVVSASTVKMVTLSILGRKTSAS